MDLWFNRRHGRIFAIDDEACGSFIIPWHSPGLGIRKPLELLRSSLFTGGQVLLVAVPESTPGASQVLLRSAAVSNKEELQSNWIHQFNLFFRSCGLQLAIHPRYRDSMLVRPSPSLSRGRVPVRSSPATFGYHQGGCWAGAPSPCTFTTRGGRCAPRLRLCLLGVLRPHPLFPTSSSL
eukprot:2295827-Amphidinium_carterae.1